MEADLQRFYRIDYRDRWRGDLTLRRIWVLIHHLPGDSASARALGGPGLDTTHVLLADVFAALVGKPHPLRNVTPAAPSPARVARLRDARRRAAERQRAIDSGEIT